MFFPVGLLPVLIWIMFSNRAGHGTNNTKGALAALVTGILAGAGNVAFYLALASGGKVSIVAPLTCLFPLVTMLVAYVVLHERLNRLQASGIAMALLSIYLLGA